MPTPPPFEPEREVQRLQRDLASQEPAELRRACPRADPLRPGDWPAVAAIPTAGITAFETAPPSWHRWDASHLPDHRLVVRHGKGGEVVAWAALAPVSDRCAYAGVAEDSVDVAEGVRGRRVVRLLERRSARVGR